MARTKAANTKASETMPPGDDTWMLRLYVAGQTQVARNAFNNLTKLCEKVSTRKIPH